MINLNHLDLLSMVQLDGYSRKILWLFVGLSNSDPNAIVYYFVNCVFDLKLVILQFNNFGSIVLQNVPII